MENAYGIGVKNRYELFYNEDVDPFEILRKQEEEKERRKTDKAQKDKSKGSKGGKQLTPGPQKKSPKEIIPSNPPKPIETSEVPNKPRNRTFGDRNAKIPSGSFDEPKENEERKNFRNREDQHFSSEVSSTFTVRNTVFKRGNQERDRGDGEFRRGRGGFRGRGRGRGRGGFSNFDGRRREFDRQSGSDKTGIRHTDKRDGGGAHNWGDIKDDFDNNRSMDKRDGSGSNNWSDIKDEFDGSRQIDKRERSNSWGDVKDDFEIQQSNQPEEPAEKSGDETIAENTESKENEPTVEGEPTEEGPREMTLDEWKREQESKRCVPKYNLRKPGEGEDNTQWKKLYMLKKKAKEEDDDEEEEEEDADDEEFGRRGRQRQLVDIQINFSDSRRGRGRGRGGRGTGPRGGGGGSGSSSGVGGGGGVSSGESGTGGIGNRGGSGGSGSSGGGRGMGRGTPKINKSPQQSAPRVDDWNDFPSLVTA